MHLDLGSLIGPLVGLFATALGGWLLHRFSSPKDHERAALLAHIAGDAAALVVAMNPGASWSALLKAVVDQIAAAAGLPTANRDAIERAAAAALTGLGKNPGAPAQ
jgi:Co/Zn/Cd efflux system component